MALGNAGKGCGCLIFVLVGLLIIAGLMVHPMSLRFLSGRLLHEDRVVPSDAVFVPRFDEDRNGELYIEAFREYWAGNAKKIYLEEDKILGLSLKEIVSRMAKERGVKPEAVDALVLEGSGWMRAEKAKAAFARAGMRRVIVLVPEYASGRFYGMYGDVAPGGKVVFLIKPVRMSYYKGDAWWRDEASRGVFVRELYGRGAHYVTRFTHGEKETGNKE